MKLVMVASACSPIVDNRGHVEQSLDLSQVIKGQSSRDDVTALLGSPSARSDFGEEAWYYITAQKQTVGVFAPEITKQTVIEITFNDAGAVKDIRSYDKEQGKPVTLVEASTPASGHSLTFMEQLFGNFGKFGTPGRSINPGRGY